jgi:hypothetical protein
MSADAIAAQVSALSLAGPLQEAADPQAQALLDPRASHSAEDGSAEDGSYNRGGKVGGGGVTRGAKGGGGGRSGGGGSGSRGGGSGSLGGGSGGGSVGGGGGGGSATRGAKSGGGGTARGAKGGGGGGGGGSHGGGAVGGGGGHGGGGGKSKKGQSHSPFLMPFINAVSDALFGGDHQGGPQYPFGALRARAEEAGFFWDRLVRCYAADWARRGVTLEGLRLSKMGHAPGKLQEELLFPPLYSPHGGAGVPEEVFNHLLLFVSQAACGAELDPSPEGRAAVSLCLDAAGF